MANFVPNRHRGTRPSAPVQGPSADISVSIRDEIEELIRRFSEANTGIERLFLG
jgi:hypothetical protein